MAWTAPRTWTDGELVTASIMNTHIRDNELAIGPHLIVRKTVDESVTSSAVLQNDDVLLMAIAANEVWHFKLILWWTAAGAGDLSASFTWPAGGTGIVSAPWFNTAGAFATGVQVTSGTANDYNTDASGSNLTVFTGIISNGGTAGNLQFQWAQNVSNATATVVKANSTLWAVKLN